MSKEFTDEDEKHFGTIQNRDWHINNEIVILAEYYPDDLIPTKFFILNKKEIKEMNEKTKRRIKHFNKNVNPVGWAGFTERIKTTHQLRKVLRDNRKKGAITMMTTQVNPKVFKHTKKEQKAFLKECDTVLRDNDQYN